MNRLVLAGLLGLLASCISVAWERDSRFAPPAPDAVAALRPGEADLGVCLAALGAPLWVWEYRGDGVAIAYGWLERRGWNASASLPVGDWYSLSFDYTGVDEEMEGLVLFFDPDLRLVERREGLLRDLTAERRRPRPSAAMADAGDENG
ncbi:MAG: hypothetical protein AB1726_02260 [Planctomycetota bacterium]